MQRSLYNAHYCEKSSLAFTLCLFECLYSRRLSWLYSARVELWERFLRIKTKKVPSFLCSSAEQDEEYFTLAEIKEKIEDKERGWKTKFMGGLQEIEVEHIEEYLESRAAKEELRYDFIFYSPTCRYIHVKVSDFN